MLGKCGRRCEHHQNCGGCESPGHFILASIRALIRKYGSRKIKPCPLVDWQQSPEEPVVRSDAGADVVRCQSGAGSLRGSRKPRTRARLVPNGRTRKFTRSLRARPEILTSSCEDEGVLHFIIFSASARRAWRAGSRV